MALPRGESGRQPVEASNARAVSGAQRSRARSLQNQAQQILSRASDLRGRPPQAVNAGTPQIQKSIRANYQRHVLAWERYARGLRACLRQSSQQLSEARQTNELLTANGDSL